MTLPPAVLWVDPGKMTGFALYARHPGVLSSGEQLFVPAGDTISSICQAWKNNLWVGWEHFFIMPSSPKADAHFAIEMIGVVRRAAMKNKCLILPHAAPSDRNVATMLKLRTLDWWPAGKDDAQSAVQHMLAWMMRTGNVPDDAMVKLKDIRT
jgi:hypothetical protein